MSFLLESLTLAYADLWNIAGMAMVLFLLTVVRKKGHVLLFIFVSYIAYVIFSIVIYIGVDQYISKWVSSLAARYPTIVGTMAIAGALLLLLSAAIFEIWVIKKKKWFSLIENSSQQSVRSVHPAFLVVLAVSVTFVSMPACIPLFTFIAVLSNRNFSIPAAVLYLSLFCTSAFAGDIVIYLIAAFSNIEKAKKIMEIGRKALSFMISIFLSPLLTAAGIWLALIGRGYLQ